MCCVPLLLCGCTQSDEFAKLACEHAGYYVNGVCMWGVGCTEPGSEEIGREAVSDALASSTTSLHDPVEAAGTYREQIQVVIRWCGVES